MPSVLWHCWLGGRKGIRPVKKEWCGGGMVICLERDSDLHMAQLMLLRLTVSSVKYRLVLPFWYRLTWVVVEKGPLNVCVCVCVCLCYITKSMVLRCARNCHALGHRGLTSSFFIPLWKRHCFLYIGLLTHTTLHCFLLCLVLMLQAVRGPSFL